MSLQDDLARANDFRRLLRENAAEQARVQAALDQNFKDRIDMANNLRPLADALSRGTITQRTFDSAKAAVDADMSRLQSQYGELDSLLSNLFAKQGSLEMSLQRIIADILHQISSAVSAASASVSVPFNRMVSSLPFSTLHRPAFR